MKEKTDPVYLDNNASTPISEGVYNAMTSVLKNIYGNPSSITTPGRKARALIVDARKKIASFLNCNSKEITFTSGGTEGLYTLIRGISAGNSGAIVTTPIEHKCILDAVESTKKPVSYLMVDDSGVPVISDLLRAIEKPVSCIVLSLVNGELGSKLPIPEISEIAYTRNIPLIIDGVAALGKMPIKLYEGISAMAFSGHKCHGPKGSGFFYLKTKTSFTPLFVGGSQEHGKRGGTENTAGIAGLSIAISEINDESFDQMKSIQTYFETAVKKIFPKAIINGGKNRIPNVSNIFFDGVDGDHLLIHLDQMGISASLGSACGSGTLEPSHVLLGIGKSRKEASSSLRFSFSKMNTKKEIDLTISALKNYAEKYLPQTICI